MLDEEWFFRHIVPEHPHVRGKVQLIRSIVMEPPINQGDEGFYRYAANPVKLFIQKRVPDFLPFNRCVRIGLRTGPAMAEIRSFYPTNGMPSKGVMPI